MRVRNYTDTRLDQQARRLLLMQTLVIVANALAGTFLPIFLYRMSQSLALIGWFHFAQFAVMGLVFAPLGKWVKEGGKMNVLRLGIALSSVFYFVLLWLGTQAVTYAIALGVLNGLAMGCFWSAYNVVYFEITEPGNRDRYNGLVGFMTGVTGIIVPWVSAFIISHVADYGYTIVFGLAGVLFMVVVVLSFGLKKRPAVGIYNLRAVFSQLTVPHNPWRAISLANVAFGVRDGVFLFMISLLIYFTTTSEQLIGNFTLIISVVSLVSFFVVGKVLKPARRRVFMLIGVIMLSVSLVTLFWSLDYSVILLYGMGTALFMPFYVVPVTSTVFDYIGRSEYSSALREEFIVMRETFMTFGRLLGLLGYIMIAPHISTDTQVFPIFFFIVGSFPLLAWLCLRPFLGKLPAQRGL